MQYAVEPIEAPGVRHQTGTFRLNICQGLVTQFGVTVRLGRDALSRQPAIQFVVAFDPKLRGGPLLLRPTWFSTCPFSQPEAGLQATGSTR